MMTSQLTNFNWIGVLVAFVPYFILGALWFTVLFKQAYATSLGRENDLPEKPAPIFIVGPALCALIITFTTAVLMNALQVSTYGGAVVFACVVGIGYLFANTVNIAINPNIPKPIMYGLVTGTYHLTGLVMVCCILVAMG